MNYQIVTMQRQKPDYSDDIDYLSCVDDLIDHPLVRSMRGYNQHGEVSCLEHSLYVSYYSYLICRRLNLNYRCAARGGLLHDFFLYDWHEKGSHEGWHGLNHPRIALENAKEHFYLCALEQDIISKHMWPLTIKLPKYKESFLVLIVDKYCAFVEICGLRKRMHRLQNMLCYCNTFLGRNV